MSSIVHSIKNLIGSIFELLGSIIQTIFNVFKGAIEGIFRFLGAVLSSILDVFKGAIHAAGGVGKFLIGNIGVLLVIGLLFFGFLQYQRSQGKTVKVGDKKLN